MHFGHHFHLPRERIERYKEIGKDVAGLASVRVIHEINNIRHALDQPLLITRSVDLHRTDTDDINSVMESPNDAVTPHCMLYPTYAVKVDAIEGSRWRTDIGGWVYAMPGPGRMERLWLRLGRAYGGLMVDSDEDSHFVNLLNQFRCQTLRNINVNIRLGKAIEKMGKIVHEHEQKKVAEAEAKNGISMKLNSGPSGRFKDTWNLNPSDCESSIEKKLLQLEAIFDGVDIPNRGLVDLIDSEGISVISDIDDTIKITGILEGKDTVLRNTFFKRAKEVPGMSSVYQAWVDKGVHVHYVSNAPWQVYPALNEFFDKAKFPQGSMHLRVINAQSIILGKPMEHKLEVIPRIIRDFPKRKFILVGDSGEHDPEIYKEICRQFPDQVIKVFIRDVSSELTVNPDNNKGLFSPERIYEIIHRFISEEHSALKRTDSSKIAMEAITTTELPEAQKAAMDPNLPQADRLEMFNKRMENVSSDMREGVFTVFKDSSKLSTVSVSQA
ncbi:hypothetical protein CLU79DRAFT_745518 [Phycomyces nitens]|nr:hypothetical protein CLU79DRAFT_745518 [Phycomyces nitens]